LGASEDFGDLEGVDYGEIFYPIAIFLVSVCITGFFDILIAPMLS
jgi:hypothetical protein